MLFTSYLAYLMTRRGGVQKLEKALENRGYKDPKVYYVMRNRGNNEVAPSDELFSWWMKNQRGKKWTRQHWSYYRAVYLNHIESAEAKEWMKEVAEESLQRDVILVCHERDPKHCQRTLLASRIVLLHPEVNYVGELRL